MVRHGVADQGTPPGRPSASPKVSATLQNASGRRRVDRKARTMRLYAEHSPAAIAILLDRDLKYIRGQSTLDGDFHLETSPSWVADTTKFPDIRNAGKKNPPAVPAGRHRENDEELSAGPNGTG